MFHFVLMWVGVIITHTINASIWPYIPNRACMNIGFTVCFNMFQFDWCPKLMRTSSWVSLAVTTPTLAIGVVRLSGRMGLRMSGISLMAFLHPGVCLSPRGRKGSSLLKIRCPLCGSVTSRSRASKGVPGTRKCKNVVPLNHVLSLGIGR